jgi:hypothetical protein
MTSRIYQLSAAALATVLLCASADHGWAQSSTKSDGFGASQVSRFKIRSGAGQYSVSNIQNRLSRQSVTSAGVRGVNQRNFLSTSSRSNLSQRSKPFSGVTRGPTVSPYLALSSPRASGSDYQSIIRPQQRRQRDNQRQQSAAIQQQRRLNQMAVKAPYSTRGDETRAPTGHAAVFQSLGSYQNTGGFFPPPSPPKRR